MIKKHGNIAVFKLKIVVLIICFALSVSASANLITHEKADPPFDLQLEVKKLSSRKDLKLPTNEALAILYELNSFDLGRFLLRHRGLNGYWTSYIILGATNVYLDNNLEYWLVHKAPTVRATRERFYIFQDQLKIAIKSKQEKFGKKYVVSVASIPCGLMDDLLSMDYKKGQNIRLIGVDLDQQSLKIAKSNIAKHGKQKISKLYERSAWDLGFSEEFDIILSNGLKIYEPDDNKIVELYRQFYKSLRKEGVVITSFLTYPPALSKNSPWKNVVQEDLLKQAAIFVDILKVKWSVYRTENLARQQLIDAGFKIIGVYHDTQSIFPTIVAKK